MMPSEIDQSTGSAFGPGDPAMERQIERRRQLEAERLQRIKDPKSRIMGIDTEALSAQIAEKQAATAAEKALASQFDHQRLQQDAQLAYLEQERLRAERTKAQYVDQFRATEQGKDKSREYDLNDPLFKKNDLPARCSDDDPRLSVSGMQKFHGEDLSYAHRTKVQQEELKMWNDEAIAAKQAGLARDKEMDELYAARALEIDQMKTSLEATARQARSATNVAVAEYQLAQAAAKREREAAAQMAELQDNVEEISNNLSGDILTENPAVGRSFVAPNRLRPDHYKGMSPAEQATFREAMSLQRSMNAEKLANDKATEAAEAAMMENMRLQGAYQDAQVAQKRAELRKQLQEENQDLAGKQFASKSFLDSKVYNNAIDASFFDQFGTTSR